MKLLVNKEINKKIRKNRVNIDYEILLHLQTILNEINRLTG